MNAAFAMQTIPEIITLARAEPACIVEPPRGQPVVALDLPDDLRHFYDLCGGLDMFPKEDWGWRIVGPHEVIPTLDATFGRALFEEDRDLYSTGLEDTLFYLASRDGSADSISIDLRSDRVGWCYDTFDGDFMSTRVYIIALSFTELLNGLFFERSAIYFWEEQAYGVIGFSHEQLKRRPESELHDVHFAVPLLQPNTEQCGGGRR